MKAHLDWRSFACKVPVAASNSSWPEQHTLNCSYLCHITQAIQGTKQSLSLSSAFFCHTDYREPWCDKIPALLYYRMG